MSESQTLGTALPEIRSLSLRQAAIAEIRRRIIVGEIASGVTFSEAGLSDELGISRAPVREALVVLNQFGWVTSQPRSGYLVAPMTLSDLRELFTVRVLLEPKTAELAARSQTRSPEQAAELTRFSESDDPSSPDWIDDHYRFHRRIAIVGQNRELDRVLSEVHLKLERYLSIESVRQALCDEGIDHRAIADAIVAGDSRAAREASAMHVAAEQILVTEAILASDGILSMPLTPLKAGSSGSASRGGVA